MPLAGARCNRPKVFRRNRCRLLRGWVGFQVLESASVNLQTGGLGQPRCCVMLCRESCNLISRDYCDGLRGATQAFLGLVATLQHVHTEVK